MTETLRYTSSRGHQSSYGSYGYGASKYSSSLLNSDFSGSRRSRDMSYRSSARTSHRSDSNDYSSAGRNYNSSSQRRNSSSGIDYNSGKFESKHSGSTERLNTSQYGSTERLSTSQYGSTERLSRSQSRDRSMDYLTVGRYDSLTRNRSRSRSQCRSRSSSLSRSRSPGSDVYDGYASMDYLSTTRYTADRSRSPSPARSLVSLDFHHEPYTNGHDTNYSSAEYKNSVQAWEREQSARREPIEVILKRYLPSYANKYTKNCPGVSCPCHSSQLSLHNLSASSNSLKSNNSRTNFAGLGAESDTATLSRESSIEDLRLSSPMVTRRRLTQSPTFSLPLRKKTVAEGDTARLSCTVQAIPDANVIWFKNEEEIHEGGRFTIKNQFGLCSLQIEEALQSDTGRYSCKAINAEGESRTGCELIIEKMVEPDETYNYVRPSFPNPPRSQSVCEGQNAYFDVTVTGYPKPTYVWFKDDIEIVESDHIKVEKRDESRQTLVIRSVSQEDAGVYKITLSSASGQAVCMAELIVTEAPPPPIVKLEEEDKIEETHKKVSRTESSESKTSRSSRYSSKEEHKSMSYESKEKKARSVSRTSEESYSHKTTAARTAVEQEDIDIDLDDPEVAKAAAKIQATFRGHKFRKDAKHESTEISTKKVEAVKVTAPEPSKQEDEDIDIDLTDPDVAKAATKIQATFRGHKARKDVHEKKEESSVKVEESITKEEVKSTEATKPADKIETPTPVVEEAIAKESTQSVEAEKPETEEVDIDLEDPEVAKAAMKIQASFRGLKARKGVDEMKAAKEPEKPKASIDLDDTKEKEPEKPKASIDLDDTKEKEPEKIKASIDLDDTKEKEPEKIKASIDLDDTQGEGEPIFTKELQDIAVKDGDKLVLEVELKGAQPMDIGWLRDDKDVQDCEDFRYVQKGNTYQLVIAEVFPDDAGTYMCEALNDVGEAETSATVTVIEPQDEKPAKGATSSEEDYFKPEFVKKPQSLTVDEGQSAKFTAEIDGEPVPTVQWSKGEEALKDSDRIKLSSSQFVHTFEIPVALSTDSGTYVCTATNDKGQTTCEFELSVREEEVDTAKVTELLKASEESVQESTKPTDESTEPEGDESGAQEDRPVAAIETALSKLDPNAMAASVDGIEQLDFRHLLKETDAGKELRTELIVPEFTRKLTDKSVSEGNSVVFSCEVTGQPEPDITWYKNNKLIKQSKYFDMTVDNTLCKLTIAEAFPEDAGEYKCNATNQAGEVHTIAYLNVDGAESDKKDAYVKPSVTQKLKDIEVLEGSAARFDCRISGEPDPEIKWYKDGKQLNDGAHYNIVFEDDDLCSLVIPDTQPSDSGIYSITAENPVGSVSSKANLFVESMSAGEDVMEDTTGDSGRSKEDSGSTDKKSSTSPDDSQQSAPEFTPGSSADHSVQEGEQLTLQCQITGTPAVNVRWYHNNQVIADSPEFQYVTKGDTHCLVIQEIFPEDAGQYTCQASNSVGSTSYGFSVQVEQKPTITKPEFSQQLQQEQCTEGDTLTLTCKVTTETPPQTSWFLDGKLVQASDNIKLCQQEDGVCTLTLKHARLQDAGEYRCTAINSAGQSTTAATVLVDKQQVAVKIMTPPKRDMQMLAGETLNIQCDFIGTPEPIITWYQDSQVIEPTDNIHIKTTSNSTQLTIHHIQRDDSGDYHVAISNNTGSDNCHVMVVICDKPDPPSKPSVTGTTKTGTDLCWTAPSNDGGAPITGYLIEFCDQHHKDQWNQLANVDKTRYTLKDMCTDSECVFRVCAVNSFGQSQPSVVSDPVTVHAYLGMSPN